MSTISTLSLVAIVGTTMIVMLAATILRGYEDYEEGRAGDEAKDRPAPSPTYPIPVTSAAA